MNMTLHTDTLLPLLCALSYKCQYCRLLNGIGREGRTRDPRRVTHAASITTVFNVYAKRVRSQPRRSSSLAATCPYIYSTSIDAERPERPPDSEGCLP
jgi:hypothetical protein